MKVKFNKYKNSAEKQLNTAVGPINVQEGGYAEITEQQFNELSHPRYSFLEMSKVASRDSQQKVDSQKVDRGLEVSNEEGDNLEDDKNDDNLEQSEKEDIKTPQQDGDDPAEIQKEVEQEDINNEEDTDDIDDQIKEEFFKKGKYMSKPELVEIADIYEFPKEEWQNLTKTKLLKYLEEKLS